jgi:DNA-binding MarR family transcriptional regulator
MNNRANTSPELVRDVLQQFRVIFGTMRQHFREIEERCGLNGSQMWVLQETQRKPGICVKELASLLSIHQSTCSLLIDRLVVLGHLERKSMHKDRRKVGLCLTSSGENAISALPGPAEGVLPAALSSTPEVVLRTLKLNLSELIYHLPGKDEAFSNTPLADLLVEER